ncbi:gephyrin-like molybdotransferase Glp [Patulibacter sp. NPDC049589]|uniref:molybdopterin molybdotransferase MoeA n=1 Tax=Patulibacter sp. NPDC049589 TaxID=3154731 RepID=UPI0034491207
MSPPQHLTPLDDAIALARRLGAGLDLPPEDVALPDAVGRTTAADVAAIHALPGFASSAMDGFAVRAADLADATADAPVTLPVDAESRAGVPADRALSAGRAIRIATGAVIPDGADAIVPYEDVAESDAGAGFSAAPRAGAFVRAAGTDLAAGGAIVEAGTRIEPHHLAPLSGAGFTHVSVRRRPRVSVFLTGDEVVRGAGPDAELPPGAVHDVNGVVVPALVRSWGCEVAEAVALPDDRAATVAAIAAATGDLVVVCGGMSMGPHDHVRPALEALGARQDLFRIALQPGKPTWLGALPAGPDRPADVPVIGLPGNPASVFVTAVLLVRAALDAALGRPPALPLRGRLTAPAAALRNRTAARRACVQVYPEGTLAVSVLDGQASHLLGSLGRANALAIVPAGEDQPAGAVVDVVPLDAADGWAHAWGSVHDHPRR